MCLLFLTKHLSQTFSKSVIISLKRLIATMASKIKNLQKVNLSQAQLWFTDHTPLLKETPIDIYQIPLRWGFPCIMWDRHVRSVP